MLRWIPYLLIITLIYSCQKEEAVPVGRTEAEIEALCRTSREFAVPPSLSATELTEIDLSVNIREFDFVSDEVGFASGSLNSGGYPVVLRTDDGGSNWEDTGLVTTNSGRGFDVFDENLIILSANARPQIVLQQRRLLPLIWITRDGGDSWEEHFINDRALDGRAGPVAFGNDGTAYLAIFPEEGSPLMARSEDQGQSWSFAFEQPTGARRFWIFGDEFYFQVGNELIVRTDLAGQLLGEITFPVVNNLWDVEIVDENNLYVTTDSLYRTADGGQSWQGVMGRIGEIFSLNSAGEGLAIVTQDYCPTDVGPSIDALLRISATGEIEVGPQVASLRNSLTAAHTFSDGTSILSIRNKIFKLE